jgi:UDP-glucose 4-epimerase
LSCLVTGVAGFVGSHLAERLVEEGDDVIGIDCFTDYYPRKIKESNIASLRRQKGFKFVEMDLSSRPSKRIVTNIETVFHLAAQPGVRASWGRSFESYVRDNMLATQNLLEMAKGAKIRKFIYVSSSSVYGDSEQFPTSEEAIPKPNSPYGVTKLAGEHLCEVYRKSFNIPTAVLRYFSVYGPRQRPDMAFNKFIHLIWHDKTLDVYGDGSQMRDYTFVRDVVSATVLARNAKVGTILNVGTGHSYSLNEAIEIIASLLGKEAKLKHLTSASGDVIKTSADISKIKKELGYRTSVDFREGLREQTTWQLGQ